LRGDILSSNIENCGKDSNSVDILQLFVQWLTTSGDAIAIVGQAVALENDKLQQIQDQKENEAQDLQLQQTLQLMKQTEGIRRLLQIQIEN
jgi:hypothetical protein